MFSSISAMLVPDEAIRSYLPLRNCFRYRAPAASCRRSAAAVSTRCSTLLLRIDDRDPAGHVVRRDDRRRQAARRAAGDLPAQAVVVDRVHRRGPSCRRRPPGRCRPRSARRCVRAVTFAGAGQPVGIQRQLAQLAVVRPVHPHRAGRGDHRRPQRYADRCHRRLVVRAGRSGRSAGRSRTRHRQPPGRRGARSAAPGCGSRTFRSTCRTRRSGPSRQHVAALVRTRPPGYQGRRRGSGISLSTFLVLPLTWKILPSVLL